MDVNVFFANPSQMKKRVPLVRLDLTVLAIRPVVNVTRRCVPDAVSGIFCLIYVFHGAPHHDPHHALSAEVCQAKNVEEPHD